MSPRTPVPRSKHFPHDEDISRERELSVTPTVGSPDADFDELAVKMLKEKKALKAELLQAVSFFNSSLGTYMRGPASFLTLFSKTSPRN